MSKFKLNTQQQYQQLSRSCSKRGTELQHLCEKVLPLAGRTMFLQQGPQLAVRAFYRKSLYVLCCFQVLVLIPLPACNERHL